MFGSMSERYVLVIDLICAEELLAGDDDGSTDPIFCINYMGVQIVSSKKEKTLNPVYF